MKSFSNKKKIAKTWFKNLRNEICNEFLNLEKKKSKKKIQFIKKKKLQKLGSKIYEMKFVMNF